MLHQHNILIYIIFWTAAPRPRSSNRVKLEWASFQYIGTYYYPPTVPISRSSPFSRQFDHPTPLLLISSVCDLISTVRRKVNDGLVSIINELHGLHLNYVVIMHIQGQKIKNKLLYYTSIETNLITYTLIHSRIGNKYVEDSRKSDVFNNIQQIRYRYLQ